MAHIFKAHDKDGDAVWVDRDRENQWSVLTTGGVWVFLDRDQVRELVQALQQSLGKDSAVPDSTHETSVSVVESDIRELTRRYEEAGEEIRTMKAQLDHIERYLTRASAPSFHRFVV